MSKVRSWASLGLVDCARVSAYETVGQIGVARTDSRTELVLGTSNEPEATRCKQRKPTVVSGGGKVQGSQGLNKYSIICSAALGWIHQNC